MYWIQMRWDRASYRGQDEADVPTEEAQRQEEARISEPQLHSWWTEGPGAAAGEGQEASDDAVGGRVPSESQRKYPRIKRRDTLDQTLRAGSVARTSYFRMCYREGEGPPGVAFLAGKKVGGAVERNRAKRVLREAVRTSKADLSGIETLVFVASHRAATARYSDLRRILHEELRRISDRDS